VALANLAEGLQRLTPETIVHLGSPIGSAIRTIRAGCKRAFGYDWVNQRANHILYIYGWLDSISGLPDRQMRAPLLYHKIRQVGVRHSDFRIQLPVALSFIQDKETFNV
jgi:hypothetical protein